MHYYCAKRILTLETRDISVSISIFLLLEIVDIKICKNPLPT